MSSASKREEKEERLLQSSRRGDLDSVLNLLQLKSPKNGSRSIDVNCKGKSKANQGWTPLHLAAYFGHKEIVKALLENGADVNARNGMGDTPLHRAAFTGRAEVVTILIQYHADVTIINGEGRKPSQVTNSSEVKQLIKAAERSLELKLEERLLTAVREGDISELKKLIDSVHPPNINCQDMLGNTPLHCAAYRGHKVIAVTLLQHGADTTLRNANGQTALDLASNKKMKQLLDVQPLQKLHKVVSRHEGLLLKRSRFFGWKKFWVVLERGVLSYFNKRADAATSMKRQGYKYLDHCKFSVPRDEKFKIKILYSDNTVQIWSIPPNEKTPQVQRQRWLNSLHEHCAYSTFYTTQPTLLTDDQEQDLVPLGSMRDSLKSARAHQQLLDDQVTGVNNKIAEVTNSSSAAQTNIKESFLRISDKLNEVAATARNMCVALTHCLDLMSQQEEVRHLRYEEEVEKRRVLEDALHVLATEHHALECSVGAHEFVHGSRMTLTSDCNEEFFDARSDIGCPPDDLLSDDDSDDGDEYVPSVVTADSTNESVEQNHVEAIADRNVDKKRASSGVMLKTSDKLSLTRSSSDNTIVTKSDRNLLECDGLLKVKSVSSDMEQSAALYRKQEAKKHVQSEVRYRTTLPVAMLSRNEFSVWAVLRQCIGKDLSRITMPVIFNEPLTFLQRVAEYMEYVHLLHTAASLDDPLHRLQYVSAFAISATASNLDRVGKPFNPLLGETYELVREDMGFKLVAEQVSHHPPVSALQVISDDFVFHVTVQPRMKFWGKGVEIQPKGMVTLKFSKHNEVYTWNNVNTCVHNIIVGQLWIEQYGQMEITNHTTGDFSILHFKPGGWFGRELNKVEGSIFSADKRKRFIIRGDWTDKIQCCTVDKFNKKDFKRESKRRRSDASEGSNASVSAVSLDSCSSGSSDGSVTVDFSAPKDLWRFQERPPHSKQMYNFTTYAMQLNELHEDQKPQLPPTDSRLRPDCRALENGDLDGATREKIRLEEKQRAAKKERSKSDRWIPRWFKEDINPYTGQLDWIFTNTYWNRDWKGCPDIF
ncbi:oxysterol-binding protein-related protein 1-like [Montipora capricornis]|uniref:oxysterol-binding protein-related protein 1-like n=1 Tax=Montipora capricornis TaxID=246305 RepID=UPI0035F1D61D